MALAAGGVPATHSRYRRFASASNRFLLVVAATAAVTLIPVIGARAFQVATGSYSIFVSFGVGIALSIAISSLGTRLWSMVAVSEDLVFGDLMLWGWIRRSLSDRRLVRATRLLGLDGHGWAPDSELSPEEQARVLQDLAVALERRDAYTHGHTNRVTRYSFAIAREMGLDPAIVENIRVAASMHDVGKMDIPVKILNKPGALTDEEYEVIKQHSVIGAGMVERLGSAEITEMVRHHHERLDGRGYPDGLAGDQIPLGARIIAVADTFDAVCSTRSYRKAARHKTALDILRKAAGTQLDRAAVDAFIEYYSGRGTFEWRVVMTTIPQRLVEWMSRSVPGGVVQGTTAALAALSIATAPLGIVPGALRLRDAADRVKAVRVYSETGVDGSAGTGAGTTTEGNDTARSGTETGSGGNEGVPVVDPLTGEIENSVGTDDPSASQDSASDPAAGTGPGGDAGSPHDSGTGIAPALPDIGADEPDDGSGPVDGITNPIDDVTDPITDPIEDVTDPITDPIDDVTDPVEDVTDPIEDVTDPISDPLDDLAPGLPDLPGL